MKITVITTEKGIIIYQGEERVMFEDMVPKLNAFGSIDNAICHIRKCIKKNREAKDNGN
jgi:hypothetical protein